MCKHCCHSSLQRNKFVIICNLSHPSRIGFFNKRLCYLFLFIFNQSIFAYRLHAERFLSSRRNIALCLFLLTVFSSPPFFPHRKTFPIFSKMSVPRACAASICWRYVRQDESRAVAQHQSVWFSSRELLGFCRFTQTAACLSAAQHSDLSNLLSVNKLASLPLLSWIPSLFALVKNIERGKSSLCSPVLGDRHHDVPRQRFR